jgi:hypothetical protein
MASAQTIVTGGTNQLHCLNPVTGVATVLTTNATLGGTTNDVLAGLGYDATRNRILYTHNTYGVPSTTIPLYAYNFNTSTHSVIFPDLRTLGITTTNDPGFAATFYNGSYYLNLTGGTAGGGGCNYDKAYKIDFNASGVPNSATLLYDGKVVTAYATNSCTGGASYNDLQITNGTIYGTSNDSYSPSMYNVSLAGAYINHVPRSSGLSYSSIVTDANGKTYLGKYNAIQEINITTGATIGAIVVPSYDRLYSFELVSPTFCATCLAGTAQPTVSSNSIANTCPATTVNLNSLVTSSTPSNTTLVWYTNNTHTGTAYATPTTAAAGTYYAYYYDATNACYSPATAAVTATVNTCTSPVVVSGTPPATVSGASGTTVTGNAPTGVSGGTSPYSYSDGTAEAGCTTPTSPTMALPAGKITGLNTSTGAHSINTTGLAAGTYQYCIKVCDTSGTNCAISKHTITVTAACNAGSTAPTLIKN